MNNLHFQTYEEVYPLASKFFNEQKKRILEIFPDLKIEHVGGSSVPGSITLGDLDIQVRVTSEKFSQVCKVFENFYHKHRLDLWTDEFALFHWKDHPSISMSIVVTVIDSVYDDFYKIRDLFRSDKDLLEKYNNIKRQYEGKSMEEYKKAKNNFLGDNGHSELL